MTTVIVTGAAGFIGYHTSMRLMEKGFNVVGIDNLNDYYSVDLKMARLDSLMSSKLSHLFTFYKEDISDLDKISEIFKKENPKYVVNLAAQAGVRYSIENPQAYIDSNITGFLNILNCCRDQKVLHLVYASSSSVYGNSKDVPFSTNSEVNKPVSIYAASKVTNELMAHVYSYQYGLPTTGLRFFTVYGPMGRPDMAPMKFASSIINNKEIDVYNNGDHWRDFTYVDDIVSGVVKVMEKPCFIDENGDSLPVQNKVYNIGAQTPVHLMKFIELIEKELGVKAVKKMLPMQLGDVKVTSANVDDLIRDHSYSPKTKLEDGISEFITWFKSYESK